MSDHDRTIFHGPKAWIVSIIVGLLLGALLTRVLQPDYTPHEDQVADEQHQEESLDDSSSIDHEPIASLAGVDDDFPAPIHDPASQPADLDLPGNAHAAEDAHAHGPAPEIPLILAVPFALLLLSIATMPFINERFWHHHFPDFAFLLGSMMVAYYLLGFDEPDYAQGLSYGQYQMLHVAREYYAFIALIGGLFVASGGILIDFKGKGGPVSNTMLLATGALIANIVGTTGASVLLIRPFMRMNKGRLHAMHVVFFIFIVSNCGGCLTPIGDPPLYLGYLKGVPFMWTLEHLWPMWLACIGLLLGLFFLYDLKVGFPPSAEVDALGPVPAGGLTVKGLSGMIALALIIGGVFIDPMLAGVVPALEGVPIGPTFQIAVAICAYKIASSDIHKANDFNFFPVKEVGLLFVGIFATMAPALGYLAANGDKLGLDSATAFYFATGALSGVLDNAPTYLNFLQVAFAANHLELTPDNVHHFLDTPNGIHELTAISLGAVFFGAMTYIGNGPNFMVRAIAEAGGLKMPSFFGYLARAVVILLPVLVVIWLLFVR